FERTAHFFDYLPGRVTLVELGDVAEALDTAWAEVTSRFEQRSVNPERPLLAPEDAFVTRDTIRAALTQQTAIVCRPEENAPETDFACDSVPTLTGNSDDATGRAL